MKSIGLVTNFHAEKFALPGLLKSAMAFFDDMVFISSPPAGTPHCEESCQLVRDAGCRLVFSSVDRGFGVLRTRCIRESKADWVMILDADERFWVESPKLSCSGTEAYPKHLEPNLQITNSGVVQQGLMLRSFIEEHHSTADAILMDRRHWFQDPESSEPWRPCQNWQLIPDHQLRLVKNTPFMFYDPNERMHEKLLDSRTWSQPKFAKLSGVFIDHYTCHFKPMDPAKNKRDMDTYRKLDEAGTKDMWLNEQAGVKKSQSNQS